jgi:hypothetical protein
MRHELSCGDGHARVSTHTAGSARRNGDPRRRVNPPYMRCRIVFRYSRSLGSSESNSSISCSTAETTTASAACNRAVRAPRRQHPPWSKTPGRCSSSQTAKHASTDTRGCNTVAATRRASDVAAARTLGFTSADTTKRRKNSYTTWRCGHDGSSAGSSSSGSNSSDCCAYA